MKNNTYRDGKVHVCKSMCETCIFRPGNKMRLAPGRVKSMIEESTKNDSAIICHDTLDGDNSVCRGFYDKHPTIPLQLARAMGVIQETKP